MCKLTSWVFHTQRPSQGTFLLLSFPSSSPVVLGLVLCLRLRVCLGLCLWLGVCLGLRMGLWGLL